MRFYHALFAVLTALLPASALASPRPSPLPSPVFSPVSPKDANCAIHVKSYLASNKTENKTLYLNAKDRAACEQAGNLQQINFVPKLVSKKEVKTEWRGQ